MKRISLALAAVAATLAVAPAAQAAPQPLSAEVLGTVVSHGDTATVRVRYTCEGDLGLWVSAKQVADGTRAPILQEEGSSQFASAMLHSHRNTLDCDGRSHVGSFEIDKVEWGFGQLEKGNAWIQFCVTDPASEHGVVLSVNQWARVRTV